MSVTRWWVGEPTVETEETFRLDSSIFAVRTTKSTARIVGRRYRDELAYNEHDAVKHLRQHGFESPEKSCVAIADEQKRTSCATKHTPCKKITWFAFHIHVARGVRDN